MEQALLEVIHALEVLGAGVEQHDGTGADDGMHQLKGHM